MNCKECKAILQTGGYNPEQPFNAGGSYLPPLCRYCNNRPNEVPDTEMKIEPKWTAQQWDYVQQLKGQILHLEKKVDQLYEKKTKRKDRL